MERDDFAKRVRRLGRKCKQEVQLVHMIARADWKFLAGLLTSASSMVVALAGWLSYWNTGLFSDRSSVAAVGGALAAILSLAFTSWDFRQYRLGTTINIPRTRTVNSINKFGRAINFADLRPPVEEPSFATRREPRFANDAFMRSEEFDNYLMNLKSLPVERGANKCFNFFLPEEEARRLQLKYLIPRVRNSRVIPTTNDKKCGLKVQLGPPMSDVQVYKTGYFDGLITNEAFRSEIYLENKLIIEEVQNSAINLTRYFPAFQDSITAAEGAARIPPLTEIAAANHIGITTVVLTRDRRVLLFRQGDTAIDRGSIVSSGSGSVDWQDLSLSEGDDDLLSIIRIGMAREFCEEASAKAVYRKEQGIYRRKTRVLHAAADTTITGFFRWVNRCGKPEFIGVSWTPFRYSELLPDDFEVTYFEFDGIAIQRMEDFQVLLDQIGCHIESYPKLKMGLSSYLALSRLAEIAGYRNSPSPQKRKLFDSVQNRLRLN